MENFSKLSRNTSFEITKKLLKVELMKGHRNILPKRIDTIVELADGVYNHFSKKKQNIPMKFFMKKRIHYLMMKLKKRE